ncbi:hypothetical protein [Nitrososphaera sp.]|uniref:hypothetical protein n=1 Tax=Nitrososphaera sp. TaxID=1971748 RepID=UPI00307DF602
MQIRHAVAIAAVATAAAAFGVFVALAQSQAISVPYLTPTTLEIKGLQEAPYGTGDVARFSVTAKGYGSNCHALEVEALGEDGKRLSYYRKADDCRYMPITYGPYNFTRPFEYGKEVLASGAGTVRLNILFEDLVDGKRVSETRSLRISK